MAGALADFQFTAVVFELAAGDYLRIEKLREQSIGPLLYYLQYLAAKSY